MEKRILFLQGGAGQDDHEADAAMVASLRDRLGAGFLIHYPLLPETDQPGFGRLEQIAQELSAIQEPVILVGHSLGASMLLKYLSEAQVSASISGVFLVSTPFWSGQEDWVQPLKLQDGFETQLDKRIPLFFYHCQDDEVVPFEQFLQYKKLLSWATFQDIPTGGHQLEKGMDPIARDLKSIST